MSDKNPMQFTISDILTAKAVLSAMLSLTSNEECSAALICSKSMVRDIHTGRGSINIERLNAALDAPRVTIIINDASDDQEKFTVSDSLGENDEYSTDGLVAAQEEANSMKADFESKGYFVEIVSY